MKLFELEYELVQAGTDYAFDYNGKLGSICPFNKADGTFFASIVFDGRSYEFFNLDELMSAPILDGKSLNEVAEEIELYG